MSEKKPISAVSEVKLMLENIKRLQEGGASREEIDKHIAAINDWLRTIAVEIEATLSGASKYEAADLFTAKYLLEVFLLGFNIAANLH